VALREPVAFISEASLEVLQALDQIVWAVDTENDKLASLPGCLGQLAQGILPSMMCSRLLFLRAEFQGGFGAGVDVKFVVDVLEMPANGFETGRIDYWFD